MPIAITTTNQPVQLNEDGTWEFLVSAESALSKLQAMEQPQSSLEFFYGLFDRLGVRITDTGEELTCISYSDRVEFLEGIDSEKVDFSIDLFAFQIDLVIRNAAKGYTDPIARFRVVRELLKGSPRAKGNALTKMLTYNSVFRKLIDAKDLLHLHLVSPDAEIESDATFTLIFFKKEWLIATGLFGDPERVLRVSTEEALELQRHMFAGSAKTSMSEIREIARWYTDWRSRVEVPVG